MVMTGCSNWRFVIGRIMTSMGSSIPCLLKPASWHHCSTARHSAPYRSPAGIGPTARRLRRMFASATASELPASAELERSFAWSSSWRAKVSQFRWDVTTIFGTLRHRLRYLADFFFASDLGRCLFPCGRELSCGGRRDVRTANDFLWTSAEVGSPVFPRRGSVRAI